jgi:hypothetical protein
MRNLKLLTAAVAVLLLAACKSPFEAVKESTKQESFTALLETVIRAAGALSASYGQERVTVDDITSAVEEFPGNGLEVTPSAPNVTVTASTGMYAGCSATLTPRGPEVVLEDVVCGEPRTDAPAPEPAN